MATVFITSSALNMLLTESYGADKILRVGRDVFQLKWIQVFLQTELLCFILEAKLVSWLLKQAKRPVFPFWHPKIRLDEITEEQELSLLQKLHRNYWQILAYVTLTGSYLLSKYNFLGQ